ncbi:MAG: hypothetical protein AVO34_04640 [Firmicutes bacterium ML8_F2]|jgi:uncharacterized protein (DUF362 family)|nr:MAG: hypothetical protein AVO34_04640 [Firmicutes bacterium ML8_F2]
MRRYHVSIVRYEKPYQSVQKAILDCNGLAKMATGARVFIKPNIVFWTRACSFPKWGVITTSRLLEDVVKVIKEHGINDITIGEGMVADPGDEDTPIHAFRALGYETLKEKYGVRFVNIMKRPFRKIELEGGISLNYNEDILDSDFVVDLPVLKTHNQTVVSLGLKNLKGTIDIVSRKKCHSPDRRKNLHYHIARLADPLPPILTVIDGIYSLERGPGFDGRMHRKNLLIASGDILSADMVGARILGYEPFFVEHLAAAIERVGRPKDLSDIEVIGRRIEDTVSHHEFDFPYSRNQWGEMPLALARQGIKGLFYRKFDSTLCTYCSRLNGLILTAIRQAWQGQPWDGVEVLTGKLMEPTPGMKATVLIGECMYRRNRNHPVIRKMLAARGCPPDPAGIVRALNGAGIPVEAELFSQIDTLPGFFMARYENNPEFDESFFRVD